MFLLLKPLPTSVSRLKLKMEPLFTLTAHISVKLQVSFLYGKT